MLRCYNLSFKETNMFFRLFILSVNVREMKCYHNLLKFLVYSAQAMSYTISSWEMLRTLLELSWNTHLTSDTYHFMSISRSSVSTHHKVSDVGWLLRDGGLPQRRKSISEWCEDVRLWSSLKMAITFFTLMYCYIFLM